MTVHNEQGAEIKRRSVVKAAAWAAPVLATAVAVPAVAATTAPVPDDSSIRTTGNQGSPNRGVGVSLVDADDTIIPYPAGTTITFTLTLTPGSYVLDGWTSSNATELSSSNPSPQVYVYNFSVMEDVREALFRGQLYGSLTVDTVINVPGYPPFSPAQQTLTGAPVEEP